MSLLISVLGTLLVVFLMLYLIGLLPIDRQAMQISRIVVTIIGAMSLFQYFAVF